MRVIIGKYYLLINILTSFHKGLGAAYGNKYSAVG